MRSFYVFFYGIILILVPFIVKQNDLFYLILIGCCFLIACLIFVFKLIINVSFIMGPNNLTIVKKSFFTKKTVIYNKGELLRIDYTYKYMNEIAKNVVKVDAILSNGNSVQIFRVIKITDTW